MLSTRTRFLVAVGVTVLGIAAIAVYAWRAFSEVTDEAAHLRYHLRRVQLMEFIEKEAMAARSLPGAPSTAAIGELVEHLDDTSDADQLEPCDPHQFAALMKAYHVAREDPRAEAWARVADAVGEMVKLELKRSMDALDETSDPARAGAKGILRGGAAVVLLFGTFSVLAWIQFRRDRADARERLRKSDRLAALGTMAASVAHEINNPLATIGGCATAVKDRLLRADGGAGHADEIEYLGMIEAETTRCSGIVRQLRDLARDAPPAMQPTDLSGIVREVVAFVGIQRNVTKTTITCRDAGPVECVCDPDKLKQLVLNLVVNARDAAGEGGQVTVGASVVETDGEGPSRVRITVEDDGVGLAPEELARVFEPFHTTKTRGLGLGLFLCERIATMHHGTIRAESEGRGRGARFVVTLPAHPRPGR